MPIFFWILEGGETGIGDPPDAFWKWELQGFCAGMGADDLLDLRRGAAILVPDLLRGVNPPDSGGFPPIFDSAYAERKFLFPGAVEKIRKRLGAMQADWVIRKGRVSEIMPALLARIEALHDAGERLAGLLSPDEYFRRSLLLMISDAEAVWRPLAEHRIDALRREKEKLECPVKISRSCRDFSENWKEKWEVFYLKDKVAEDAFGPMRGILNLDTGKFVEAVRVFDALGKKRSDRRTSPFEHIRICWPADFSDRSEMLQIVRLVLSLRGMADNPAMWAVSRKKGNPYCLHVCICRITLCPDESGQRPALGSPVPESLDLIRERIAERIA